MRSERTISPTSVRSLEHWDVDVTDGAAPQALETETASQLSVIVDRRVVVWRPCRVFSVSV